MKNSEKEFSQDFIDQVWKNFTENDYLKSIPSKRKKRFAILLRILRDFQEDRIYEEQEINEIIMRYHEDYCFIRREMICEQLMDRDNGKYWIKKDF